MHWSVVGDNLGFLFEGFVVTIEISALALVLALAIGVVVASLRAAQTRLLRAVGDAYVEFFRNIPLLVQLYFWFLGLGSVGIKFNGFTCGVLGLGIYAGAFFAEAIKSGILAVPRGQLEAGLSSGMSYIKAMRLIVLPQAVRTTIPLLGNQTINLIKNSALVSVVAVGDILHNAETLGSRTFYYVEPLCAAAVLYLLLTIPSAIAVNALEKRAVVPSGR